MKSSAQKGPRILIVEDDPFTLEALAYILEVEGYRVSTARDGKKGRELLRAMRQPSAVILDLRLPIIDGRKFLRRLKQEPGVADVPVFVVTSDFAPKVPEATAVLPKPVDLPKLLSLLPGRSDSKLSR